MTQLRGLRFDLGDDIAMLRDTVQTFAADEIPPRAATIDHETCFLPTCGRSVATSASTA